MKNCSPEELHQFPTRLALTDAMKHMGWMVQKYEDLEQEFPDLTWNSAMVSHADLEVSMLLALY